MDQRPSDQNQDDQSYIEFEIIDIDAVADSDARKLPARASLSTSVLGHVVRHNRLWFTGLIALGCVIICLLLFPDVASFISPPVSPEVTIHSTFRPDGIDVVSDNRDVTVVMGSQIESHGAQIVGELVRVTAYDTRNGALLWRTAISPSASMTYGLVQGLNGQDIDVYTQQSDGLTSLLAPRTGKVLWQYKFIPATILSAYESEGAFFFQCADNSIYALKDGRLLWQGAALGSVLLVGRGVIYTYNSINQSYAAFSETSGKHFWSYAVPGSTIPTMQTIASVAVENNTLYFQTINNTLLALQLDGHVLWSHHLPDALNMKADADHLYAVDTLTGTFNIFNLQQGKLERSYREMPGANGILSIQGNLAYLLADEGLNVINIETGKTVWQYKTNDVDLPMWVEHGAIYMASPNNVGPIQALDARNGRLLWSILTSDHLSGLSDSVVDLISRDNSTISIVRLSDGKILWRKNIL